MIKQPRLVFLLILFPAILVYSQNKRALTFKDVMQFKQIKSPVISSQGNWIAYEEHPDRGNGTAVIKSTGTDVKFSFDRGSKIKFSKDESWAAVTLKPDFAEAEKSKKKLKDELLLINTNRNNTFKYKSVLSSAFSNNAEWAAMLVAEDNKEDSSKTSLPEYAGNSLIVKSLESLKEDTISFVAEYKFDSLSTTLAYSVSDTNKLNNGLYFYSLDDDGVTAIDTSANCSVSNLSWKDNKLAYLKSFFNKNDKADTCDLKLWDGSASTLTTSADADSGWYISEQNKLEWSPSGNIIYFGYKKMLPEKYKPEDDSSDTDIFDFDKLLSKTTLNLWHWNDQLIKTNEEKEWKNKKKHLYTAVYNVEDKRLIRLADDEIPYTKHNINEQQALGNSPVPYLKLRTWDGWYSDYYTIDLSTGNRTKVIEKQQGDVELSPGGGFLVYYSDKNWFLYNIDSGSRISLTQQMNVPFADEDNDYPREPQSYGVGGWTENDEAVFIYDKYDIWKFNTRDGSATNLTGGYGRDNELTFRIKNMDKEKHYFESDEELLLTAFHNWEKYTAVYSVGADEPGVKELIKDAKKFKLLCKAEDSGDILYSRETYDEFPDLWVTSNRFGDSQRLTNLDEQREPFAWGSAELIEWNSLDGVLLQGVIIKPGNYEPGRKYPVLVYYYRFFSQRVHEFNDMVVNHRPNFPFYASNDYVVFLPDIRFEVGRPGFSATKCLVPGVQKLIDMGLADPDGIGLHGHSWSGYQTALVITQTDLFACAIAGAPVSNMTSAYSGIRWGTGLARQFQYEKSQSRIGGSLWEYPERYLENSPVFFADKIHTPLLIEFGDKDDAVPWYQGIELYLAMRRLEKDCVFLQYKDEPHHLKKYPNKLDYSIRMKEYLDHYCKGIPAPEWVIRGEPYIGN